eukprot:1157358-Pelagomonas_calceolata.AAC.5
MNSAKYVSSLSLSFQEELAGVQFTDPSHAQDQPVPTAAAQQQPMAATLLPPPVDTWEQHVERVLTDAQASATDFGS